MDLDMNELVSTLKALSDETRLRIVNLLLTHDLCVGAVAHRLGLSSPAISQHIQVLRRAGFIKGEKRGYWTHYVVEQDLLNAIADKLILLGKQEVSSERVCLLHSSGKKLSKERRCKDMCEECCAHPEKLKGKPEECSPEQIKECHGDVEKHPCEEKRDEK